MTFRWLRRYTRRVEDRKKILDRVKELNGGKETGDWDEALNFTMLPSMTIDAANKSFTVNPTQGMAVKLFINTKTGETIMEWADIYIKTQ